MRVQARDRRRASARRLAITAVALLSAGALAACGGAARSTTQSPAHLATAASTTTTNPTTTSTATISKRAPSPLKSASARHDPPVGRTQRVTAAGTSLAVTVTGVLDPLRSGSAEGAPGTRPVAVTVAVRNLGPGGYDSSATGDFSLYTAAGKASPVFVNGGVCATPLRDFMNAIGPGELRTGCVAFAVPRGQRPTSVRFSPNGGSAGVSRSWAVG